MPQFDGKQLKDAPLGVATAKLNDQAVTNAKIADSTIDISKFNPATQNAITAGKTWKELLLIKEQLLGGAAGGVLQAILVALDANVVNGDTFVLTDGTTTETFTFLNTPVGAFDVQIGASAADTLANLVAAINLDSTLWSAHDTTELSEHFAGSYANQAVVYRTAVSTAADRAYGTLATATDVKVVEFETSGIPGYELSSGSEGNLPSADPAAKRFGFGRAEANLVTNETHLETEQNGTYTWDDNDQLWRQTDSGAISATNGLVKSGNSIEVLKDVTGTAQQQADSVAIQNNPTGLGVDGELVNVASVSPSNYTPNPVGNDATIADQLGAHLQGIDDQLATANAQPIKSAKNLTALATVSDNDQATSATVPQAPAGDGYLKAEVNGIGAQVGDGTKVGVESYFSGDGGTTARAIADVTAGDTMHWNGSVAGYELAATDRIDWFFDA